MHDPVARAAVRNGLAQIPSTGLLNLRGKLLIGLPVVFSGPVTKGSDGCLMVEALPPDGAEKVRNAGTPSGGQDEKTAHSSSCSTLQQSWTELTGFDFDIDPVTDGMKFSKGLSLLYRSHHTAVGQKPELDELALRKTHCGIIDEILTERGDVEIPAEEPVPQREIRDTVDTVK